MSMERERKSRRWESVCTNVSGRSETRIGRAILILAITGSVFFAATNCIADDSNPVWTSSDLGDAISSMAVVGPHPHHDYSLTAVGLPLDGKVFLFKSGSNQPLWSKTVTIPNWGSMGLGLGGGDSISMSLDPVRVVVGMANGLTNAYDLDGNLKWSKLCGSSNVPVLATAITSFADLTLVGSGGKMCGYDISGNQVFTYQVAEDHTIRNIEVSLDGGIIALATLAPSRESCEEEQIPARVYVIKNTMWRAVGDGLRGHTPNVQLDVEDKSSRTYPVIVENRGQTMENISLSTSVITYGWTASVDKENLYLIPGESEKVNFTIEPPANTMPFESTVASLNASVTDNSSAYVVVTTTTIVVENQNSNSIPTATIDSISNTTVSQGTNVSFSGHGSDTDGSVDSYRWKSSIDGILSYSSSFTTSSLSVGVHTIYFDVQDDDDHWSLEDRAIVIILPSAGYSLSTKVDYEVWDSGATARITWDGKRVAAGEFDYGCCPVEDDGSKVFYFTSGADGIWGTQYDVIPLWIAIEPDDIGGIAIAEENGRFVFASPVGGQSDGYTDAFFETSSNVIDSWDTGDARTLEHTMILQYWADGDGYLVVGSEDDDVIYIHWHDDGVDSYGDIKWTYDTEAPVTEVGMIGSVVRGEQPGPGNIHFWIHLYAGNSDFGVKEGGYVYCWLYNWLNDY